MNILLKRNDKGYSFTYTLVDENDVVVDLTGASVLFNMGDRNSVISTKPATVVDAINGVVSYTFAEDDTLLEGNFIAEFSVTSSTGTVITYPRNNYLVVNIMGNVNTNGSNITLDLIAAKQGDFEAKLESILLQTGNLNMSAINDYTWSATAGQLTYTMPVGANYDSNSKWFEVQVGGIPIDPNLVVRNTANQFTLLVDSALIQTGMVVRAKWTEPIVPVTSGHHAVHEKNGADELDITKLKNYDIISGDVGILIGKGVIPEKFPKIVADGTNDAPRIQRAIDYAVANNISSIDFDTEWINLYSTINIPSGVKFRGRGATRLFNNISTVIERKADVVAIQVIGTAENSGTGAVRNHIQGVEFHDIQFRGGGEAFTKDFMKLEVTSMFVFERCLFRNMGGRQIYMREAMDSRFVNCYFEDCFSTTVPAIELDGGYTDGTNGNWYDFTNQIYFIGCRWENYKGCAFKTSGTNTNEIFFTDCKMESLLSTQPQVVFNDVVILYLGGLQITSRGDGVTTIDNVMTFTKVRGVSGSVFMEHNGTSLGSPINSYVKLDQSHGFDMFLYIYDGQEKLTGTTAIKSLNSLRLETLNIKGNFRDVTTKKILDVAWGVYSAGDIVVSGANYTPSYTNGYYHKLRFGGTTTFTFNNPTDGVAGKDLILQVANANGSTAVVPSFGTSYKMNITPASIAAGRKSIYRFTTDDGVTWYLVGYTENIL